MIMGDDCSKTEINFWIRPKMINRTFLKTKINHALFINFKNFKIIEISKLRSIKGPKSI